VAEPPVTFAALLRELRSGARLTQEELAEAAALSPRSVSDLERGIATAPRRETVRLLADALGLTGPARAEFEAAARGRPVTALPVTGGAAALRTLPRDIASFTGRQQELAELVEAAAGAGGVAGIHAIGGMAGVGKTAFAVHAAHRLTDRFPGGQIFLSLHGHTPGQQPVDPADALASLLLTAGVPPAQIPPGLEARMALWRDRLAERQLLLILDDAASSEQVRPLLPGAGGSLVLVTSRRHLSALDDATAVSLDTLPPGQAAALLVRLAGRAGLIPADPAVAEIARLCGYLPLAIGMVARQLHHHPAWTAASRAAELAAAVDRLDLMATENLSVAAAFNLSYADLTEDQRRLFRRLGLYPGTDIDGYAGAALDGTDLAAARRGLEALYDQYLLTEPAQGRYRMHDLIREHARALAGRLDPDHDRDDAVIRLLDYYHHTAARADAFLARQARPALAPPDGAIPAAIPAMADAEQAFAWARAERASLLACLDHVTRTDQYARIISLTAGLAGLLRRDGPWTDAITRQTLAVQAARHLGDRLGQANALSHLANVRGLAGDYPGALRELTEALGLHHKIGDRLGEACDLHDRGDLRGTTGDYPGAARDLEEALSIYREIGSQVGQANTLANLGYMRGLTGDYPGAVQALEQALGIHREIGDRFGQAGALTDLGEMRLATADYSAATQALEQALDIHREIGTRLGQANTLDSLGRVRSATGDYTGAAEVLEEALAIARDIGNRLAQANALDSLGHARSATGDYPGAAQALEEALALNLETGSPLGQANALDNLGKVRLATGDYPGAAQALEQALDIHRELGDRTGQATALGYLGDVRRVTGDYLAAAQALEQALDIFRDIGNRNGEAEALNGRGTLHRVRGELAQAEECHRRALETARAIASSQHEAHALADLGRCAMAAGRATQAEALLRQALEVFQRIGAAEAAAVSAELDALIDPRPAE